MPTQAERMWAERKHAMAMEDAALSLVHEKRSNFLGAEVKEATDVETMFIEAWRALGNGDAAAAIGLGSLYSPQFDAMQVQAGFPPVDANNLPHN